MSVNYQELLENDLTLLSAMAAVVCKGTKTQPKELFEILNRNKKLDQQIYQLFLNEEMISQVLEKINDLKSGIPSSTTIEKTKEAEVKKEEVLPEPEAAVDFSAYF
jgi:hypothetical protein